MGLYLIILLVIGVIGKQSQRYYTHVLAAVGVWLILAPTALWLSARTESADWGFLGFLLMGVSYAIPIVIIAIGYEGKAIQSLIPRRRGTSPGK